MAGSGQINTPITRTVLGKSLALDAPLHLWAMEAYKKYDPLYTKMASVRNVAKGDRVITMQATGLGPMPQKAEYVQMVSDGIVEGHQKTVEIKTRGLSVHISQETIEDSGRLKQVSIAKLLAKSANDAEEIDTATVVNNGTATTYYTSADGLAVFSGSHKNLDGSTYSNLTTGYLAYTVLKSALLAIRKRADHRSAPIMLSVSGLWVPPDQQDKAEEVVFAHGLPNSTDNDAIAQSVSSLRGKIMSNPWFTGTNACMIRCKESADNQGIVFWRRIPFGVVVEDDKRQGGKIWRGRTRYRVDVSDPRTLQGFGYSA